ncbi:YciI family protein [Kribbella monticola]|uniref:YciI family protein n=1 Tax=Kribbella monticola TaxID=2185285 RepID=UPI000DD41D25|nr:YciI family protein [Kribbella monticola]
MKYMLLIYGNEETWAALKADGMDAVMERHREVFEETKAAGEFIESHPLTTSNARIVQLQDGVSTVTDGPFTEAKEVLAGYYLLECSLERATEIAARLPEAPYSPIEIREVPDEE